MVVVGGGAAAEGDSHDFFAGAAAVLLAVVDEKDDFLELDSSSEFGFDEAVEAAVEEVEDSEIFPNVEPPAFQLGVCFFQAGWATSLGFSSTGASGVDLWNKLFVRITYLL